MKPTLLLLAALISTSSSTPLAFDTENVENIHSNGRTVHFFVLMVPDSAVQELQRERARQDEDAGIDVSETGAYVGQIISGVLGGDVRPIFAGSASFIGEPDVQQGVSTILANVAPSVNNILKQWVTRAQTFLGITTTLRPGTVLANQTSSTNGTRPTGTQAQTAQLQQQLNQLQQQYKPQTIGGSDVIAGNDLFDLTTVAPLPIINKNGDDEEESEGQGSTVIKAV